MRRITQLYLGHTQPLFFSERSHHEGIRGRGSLSMQIAAIPFAVFAFSSLTVEVNLGCWGQLQPPLLVVDEKEAVIMVPSHRLNLHHHGN